MIKINHLFCNAYRTTCALVVLFCVSIAHPGWSQSKSDVQNSVLNSRRSAIVNAVENASPAVVNISTIQEVVELVRGNNSWSRTYGFPFWSWQRGERRGLGSGVIFNQAGYVLTNQHVIEDADTTKVILSDGREYEARIVGEDFLSDLAVLEIDAAQLSEIKQGDSDDLMIGEWAIAIGHPFALAVGNPKPTVTIGVISATDRVLKTENRHYHNLIQTDASINPGNSGGPLVNLYGELIGINTAIYSTSGGSQGIGFAIPANDAKQIVSHLVAYGSVVPPYIGISVQDLPQEIAENLKLDGSIGVLVSAVDDNSPAKKAGMRRGDVIEAINQQPILNSEEAFRSTTRLLNKHQTVTFQLFRRGKRENLHLKIEELQWRYELPGWGITVEQLNLESGRKFRQRGVVVAKINRLSTLARRGLKRGDLIFQISNNPVRSVEDFKLMISELRQNQRISIHFERDGKRDALYDLIIQR